MAKQLVPSPRELGLNVDRWRPGQVQVQETLAEAFEKNVPVVVDAPPGAGKSLIAVAIARMRNESALILTATKALQAQYTDEPTLVPSVTGRRNPLCLWVPGAMADDGPCLTDFRCPERHSRCPYFQQRDAGMNAPLVVGNYALVLSDPERQLLQGRLLICDEAHLLEDQIAAHVGCRIEPWITCINGLDFPQLPNSLSPLDFQGWAAEVLETISHPRTRLEQAVERNDGNVSRELAHLLGVINRLERICQRLCKLDDPWVVSHEDSPNGGPNTVILRPTQLAQLAHHELFDHVSHLVLLSGSLLQEDGFRARLGLDNAVWIRVSSPIPAHRRPIVYWPVVPISRDNYKWSLPQIVQAVDRLIDRHSITNPAQKGIIHVVNAKNRDYLATHSRHARLFFLHQTEDRTEVFYKFRAAPAPAVLVSPSAFVGEDFPGEQARWQAIVKIPYPDLSDRWVAVKKSQDPGWYTERAAGALAQACGRVARCPDDYGITYILDANFHRVWEEAAGYLPAWFHEGLKIGHRIYWSSDIWWLAPVIVGA